MSRIVATLSIAVAALVCASRVLAGDPATPATLDLRYRPGA